MAWQDFKKKLTAPLVWGNCLGMIVVSVAAIIGGMIFLNHYTHQDEIVTMPDVRGMDSGVAIKELAAAGLSAYVEDTGFVYDRPADIILDQSPVPGHKVKPGRKVELTINSHKVKMVALPDLADNCSLREAEIRLHTLGFKTTEPKRVDGDRDWVYGMKIGGRDVSGGTKVAAKSTITLVVGKGMPEEELDEELNFIDLDKEFASTEEDEL